MGHIESIVKIIEDVFNLSEEKISSLASMLSGIEANRLYGQFSLYNARKKYLPDDLISKANLLNALLELILENPNMEEIPDEKRKEWISEVCETISVLYEELLSNTDTDAAWGNMPWLVMYSMLSYMADRQTTSDLVIREYCSKLTNVGRPYKDACSLRRLEYDTYFLIVFLMSNIRNYEGLLQLNNLINRANQNLDETQKEELDRNEFDLHRGLRIGAFGNIIYLTDILKKYLFSGEIERSENQDIYGVIDMYSFNAFHLLADEQIELKLIGHLLRYAYEKVAENSIWNIAEKSPLIKRFIKENLAD